jgi:hypothetical protein
VVFFISRGYNSVAIVGGVEKERTVTNSDERQRYQLLNSLRLPLEQPRLTFANVGRSGFSNVAGSLDSLGSNQLIWRRWRGCLGEWIRFDGTTSSFRNPSMAVSERSNVLFATTIRGRWGTRTLDLSRVKAAL